MFKSNDQELLNSQHYAALDLGSNSFHLIVAKITHNQIQTLHKIKQRVRLAQGLNDNGLLSKESIEDGLNALKEIAPALASIPCANIRIVATYTLRAAKNADEFLLQARNILPYSIEIISGIEEARLIYQGFAHNNSTPEKRLIIDIGGGSTEMIIGENFETKKLTSKSIGCVSFANQYFPNGQLTEQAFELAVISAEQEVEELIESYQTMGWQTCFGTSGTIKAISEAINQAGWLKAQSSPLIKRKHLEKLKQLLLSFSHVNEINIPGVSEQRRSVLAGGLAILIAIYESFEIKGLVYSDAALRDGILYELANADRHEIKQRTINSIQQRYDVDLAQANRVEETAQCLFKKMSNLKPDERLPLSKLMSYTCLLHEIGLQINSTGYHKHSAYVIENSNLIGFNQEEQAIISFLLRNQRKKIKQLELPLLSNYKTADILLIMRLVRLALVINIRRIEQTINEIEVLIDNHISLYLPKCYQQIKPLLIADLKDEQTHQENAGFTLSIGFK